MADVGRLTKKEYERLVIAGAHLNIAYSELLAAHYLLQETLEQSDLYHFLDIDDDHILNNEIGPGSILSYTMTYLTWIRAPVAKLVMKCEGIVTPGDRQNTQAS